jgi:tRNA pseudouridine38-40 synthase
LLNGLHRRGLTGTERPKHLEVASRTDRGVHARGNAVVIPSPVGGPALLRALNGLAPDLFFTRLRAVDADFRPRSAEHRTYRYFEPREGHDIDRWRTTAQLLAGRLDVRSLGRGLPPDRPTIRDVDSVRVGTEGVWMVIEVQARSFVWGMVRKMVAALRAVESGTVTEHQLATALKGRGRLALPLAEGDRLILWDVTYPDEWPAGDARFTIRQERYWESLRTAAAWRAELVDRLDPTPGKGHGTSR